MLKVDEGWRIPDLWGGSKLIYPLSALNGIEWRVMRIAN
jgi:hypothetical protein